MKELTIILISVLVTAYLVHYADTHATIFCYSGTQVLVNTPDEYPVYSIECSTNKILILD